MKLVFSGRSWCILLFLVCSAAACFVFGLIYTDCGLSILLPTQIYTERCCIDSSSSESVPSVTHRLCTVVFCARERVREVREILFENEYGRALSRMFLLL